MRNKKERNLRRGEEKSVGEGRGGARRKEGEEENREEDEAVEEKS
jgi:hypothetical protein